MEALDEIDRFIKDLGGTDAGGVHLRAPGPGGAALGTLTGLPPAPWPTRFSCGEVPECALVDAWIVLMAFEPYVLPEQLPEERFPMMSAHVRPSVITDWHLCSEDDLPDVPPGEIHERAIAPQKFVVLRRVLVRDMVLVQLSLGADVVVPFELEDVDGHVRIYRPCNLEDGDLERRLVMVGAKIATHDSIAVAPGLEVRVLLRNDGAGPAKPRVALVVREELMPHGET